VDVRERFVQATEMENGVLHQLGRLDLVRHKVLEFAMLDSDDEVAFGSHRQL